MAAASPPCTGGSEASGACPAGSPSPYNLYLRWERCPGELGEQEQSCLRSPADVGQRKATLSYFGRDSDNPEQSEQRLHYHPQACIQPYVPGAHQERADGDLGLLPRAWDALLCPELSDDSPSQRCCGKGHPLSKPRDGFPQHEGAELGTAPLLGAAFWPHPAFPSAVHSFAGLSVPRELVVGAKDAPEGPGC